MIKQNEMITLLIKFRISLNIS